MYENESGLNDKKNNTVISGQSADERLMAGDKMTPNRTISRGLENTRLNSTPDTNRTNLWTNTSTSTALPLSTTTLSYISMSSTSTTGSPVSNTTIADYTREPPIFGWDVCYSTPDDYELIPSVICSTLVVLGVVYLMYGYRCFKAVLFLIGFAFGTTIIYLICTVEKLMPMYGNVSVSVLAGLLFGLITVLVVYVGLFMLGFHLGLLSTCAILIVIYLLTPYVESVEPPNSVWILFVIFMSMGLTGACATLYFQKGCTILATVLYGSTLTIICVDYFIENFKLLYWFRDKLRDGHSMYDSLGMTRTTNLCLISWVLLALWPASCLVGLIVQWLITSKGINYSNDYNYGVVTSTTSRSHSAQLTNANRIRREEQKIEQRQRKYRYLYQVRTAHGDVISQSYIQSLHKKKVLPPDDSLTYNSDLSSHLTIIPSDSRTTTMSVA